MYLDYFGLTDKPFALTPNTSFLVELPALRDCLNLLELTLADGEGFIRITGEVGTGKTLLCRALLHRFGDRPNYQLAWLPNPRMSADALRRALAREIGLDPEGLDEHALLARIDRRLIELAAEGRSTVLLIDEAQAMSREGLETLRLLTNLETERRKLLQVVLLGQPELDELLARDDLRQLRQRITFSASLRPLDREETARYLATRLERAGYRGLPLFSKGAIDRLARASGGIPRLLNILAHKSLMSVFGEGRQMVKVRHVRAARNDTEGARRAGWFW